MAPRKSRGGRRAADRGRPMQSTDFSAVEMDLVSHLRTSPEVEVEVRAEENGAAQVSASLAMRVIHATGIPGSRP